VYVRVSYNNFNWKREETTTTTTCVSVYREVYTIYVYVAHRTSLPAEVYTERCGRGGADVRAYSHAELITVRIRAHIMRSLHAAVPVGGGGGHIGGGEVRAFWPRLKRDPPLFASDAGKNGVGKKNY
jgi:hypothetical protein